MKRFGSILLACVLICCSVAFPANATDIPNDQTVISRVSNRLNSSIPGNTIAYLGDEFSLDRNETVSYNCTYTPKSASLDFGFIAPDGLFYSINCTSGSINKSIKVDTAGQYTLAIRNNESYAVTVSGTVKY